MNKTGMANRQGWTIGFTALSALLFLGGCTAKKPDITADRITGDLTDRTTGRISAGALGRATPGKVRIVKIETKGNEAAVTVDVDAVQSGLGRLYRLSARLRLDYAWNGKAWDLKQTEEVRKWRQLNNESPNVVRPGLNPSLPDDSAIQQLDRAKRLTRRDVYNMPMLTP